MPEPEAPPETGAAALVGDDGWLFVRDDRHLTQDQLRGQRLLSREEIEAKRDILASRHNRLRELGIPYLPAVAPIKERLVGEFLPRGVSLARRRPGTQLNKALVEVNGGELFDLLPALRHAKGAAPLFDRTDSRWNHRGAFFAYRSLMKEAGKRVLALEPLLPEEAHFVTVSRFRGDLAEKPKFTLTDEGLVPADDDGAWEEETEEVNVAELRAQRMPALSHLEVTGDRAPHVYEVPDAGGMPRGMLIGDSWCLALIPWLAEHFSRLVFLWTPHMPLEAIELEAPDILFYVVGERSLAQLEDVPPSEGDSASRARGEEPNGEGSTA
jgi:hypothetical protein